MYTNFDMAYIIRLDRLDCSGPSSIELKARQEACLYCHSGLSCVFEMKAVNVLRIEFPIISEMEHKHLSEAS